MKSHCSTTITRITREKFLEVFLFEPFRTNYVWNLAVNLALGSGGVIGEVDAVCRSLQDAAARNDDPAQEEFVQAWSTLAERVHGLAQADERAGNLYTAARKFLRASMYYMTAERHANPHDARKPALYRKMQDCFKTGIRHRKDAVEWVEIPYQGAAMPALFFPVPGASNAPCMIHFDGLDVMKEWIYLAGIAQELQRRGVATLIVDHPGVGEALRLRNLPSIPEMEKPATASLDWLATRKEVDALRTGIMAVSLGGYYAPRAAAFEPRLKCCVAWGAQWDWHERIVTRLDPASTSQRSVPHFVDHLNWVFGQANLDDSMKIISRFKLEGIAQRIACPLLIVHGENDRQIPLAHAEALLDAAVNSPAKELKVFRQAEGGIEHCQADNGTLAIDYMADWVARTLGGRTQ